MKKTVGKFEKIWYDRYIGQKGSFHARRRDFLVIKEDTYVSNKELQVLVLYRFPGSVR